MSSIYEVDQTRVVTAPLGAITERRVDMKKFVTAVALAALVATPALAKTVVHKHPAPQSAQGLYLQAEPSNTTPSRGQDPDPNIRSELQRDYGQSLGAY